ncbi:hypothetical protein PGB90_009370 [Kerria lacca]
MKFFLRLLVGDNQMHVLETYFLFFLLTRLLNDTRNGINVADLVTQIQNYTKKFDQVHSIRETNLNRKP